MLEDPTRNSLNITMDNFENSIVVRSQVNFVDHEPANLRLRSNIERMQIEFSFRMCIMHSTHKLIGVVSLI